MHRLQYRWSRGAVVFQKDMERSHKSLTVEIPKVFESKDYEKQRNKIVEEFQQKQKNLFSSLEEEALAKGFAIRRSARGCSSFRSRKRASP